MLLIPHKSQRTNQIKGSTLRSWRSTTAEPVTNLKTTLWDILSLLLPTASAFTRRRACTTHRPARSAGRWNRPHPRPPVCGPPAGGWHAPRVSGCSPPRPCFHCRSQREEWGRRWWSSQSGCGCQARCPPAPGRLCRTQKENGGDDWSLLRLGF